MARSKVKHFIGPNADQNNDYLYRGIARCGVDIGDAVRHEWPAHTLAFTTCKKCLAWARKNGVEDER